MLPPVWVLLLEPTAQTQNEVPHGERVVVAVVDRVPDCTKATRGSDYVVFVQPKHVLGVELFSYLAPTISNIVGLIEH